MAIDKGTRLIRDDNSEVGVVAVVGIDGGPVGGGGGSSQASPGYTRVVSDTSGTQPIGTPADAAGANTLIGLSKQANINLLTPIPFADNVPVAVTPATAAGAILFTADTAGYGSVSVQLTGTWVGQVGYFGSNDGVNWLSAAGQGITSATSQATVSDTANTARTFMASGFRYIRGVVNTYTSGTIGANVILRATGAPPFNPVNTNAAITSIAAGTNTIGGVLSSLTFNELTASALAANTSSTPATRTATTAYAKFSATAGADAAGAVLIIRGSNDGFTNFITLASATIPAASRNTAAAGVTISVPVNFTAFQAYINNGGTANTVALVSSFTAS